MLKRLVTRVHEQVERIARALSAPGFGSSDFDLNPDRAPAGRTLRPAGVVVPLIARDDRLFVVLTKRSSHLRHHPGQIAFPGGKQDDDDADVHAAALREAHEEIGLQPGNVRSIGQLPSHETVTGFSVTPVVAQIIAPFTPVPEPGEVDEVFQVPFEHVTNPLNFIIESRYWLGQKRFYYAVPYGPYYIWGATARMLRGLAEQLNT